MGKANGGSGMKRFQTEPVQPAVVWREEARTLTLEGEPVLEYRMSWPEVQGAGLGGRWISRYYARLARDWRLRWQREVYWKACLELAARRAEARPFTPWSGALTGEQALWEDGLLSLRLTGEETRGDGRPCRVRWGDVWKVREGTPCTAGELLGGGLRWKKRAVDQILEQGRQRRAAGDCFLDPGWEKKAARAFPHDLCLTPEGVEAAFPQCSIAPAAEGNPVFVLNRRVAPNENAVGETKKSP